MPRNVDWEMYLRFGTLTAVLAASFGSCGVSPSTRVQSASRYAKLDRPGPVRPRPGTYWHVAV